MLVGCPKVAELVWRPVQARQSVTYGAMADPVGLRWSVRRPKPASTTFTPSHFVRTIPRWDASPTCRWVAVLARSRRTPFDNRPAHVVVGYLIFQSYKHGSLPEFLPSIAPIGLSGGAELREVDGDLERIQFTMLRDEQVPAVRIPHPRARL